MQTIVVVVLGLLFVIALIWGAIAAQKRREAMGALAQRLGLTFSGDKNYDLARHYQFLNKLCQGSDRYTFNVLRGQMQGHEVTVFDYHYETTSTNSKGQQERHDHFFSFFILVLPRAFPELTIAKEGLLSKIVQAVGYDDIDFESHEFSRRFCVRSPDKKFAYDICHVRMMAYLLENQDLSIEIEQNALALAFDSCLEVPQIESNLERLLAVRSLMPNYLFDAK